MALVVGSTVIDVADLDRALRFWTAALGYEPKYPPAADFALLRDPSGKRQNVSLQLNGEPKRDVNRLHLDLYADDPAAEVARLEALGARRIPWEWYEADSDYVVMVDTEGNEFCVVQA